MPETKNSQWIVAIVSPKVYQILLRAADLTGATLNRFLVQSAFEKAQEIIDKERFIKLTERSAEAFFKALDHPLKPNAKLIKAAQLYKDHSPEK